MPRLLPRSSVAAHIALLVVLGLAACAAPSPTPTLPAPTALAELATPSSTEPPTKVAHIPATDTATATSTDTATATATDTLRPTPPRGRAVGLDVRFMSQLISYFSALGTYPPEPIPSRPANIDSLTGLEVSDPTLLQRRPILARLGNNPQSRPHAGLNQADLVFEEMIDQQGGIFFLTRLTAVFFGQDATIRPFRSARQINASLQPMFDGALAHSGASKGVRYLFSQLPWGKPVNNSLNLDDLSFGSAYCSIGSSYLTRMASTTTHIHDVLASKGLEQPVAMRGFDFSAAVPVGTPAASVALDHKPWAVANSSVEWKYDEGSGNYLRYSGGVAHNTQQYGLRGNWGGGCSPTGATTTEQVKAANVVVMDVEYEPTDARDFTEDTLGSTSVFIELTGSGTARIYRDGVEIAGTWRRPTLQHFFQFFDANGNPVPLKPGNTWFELAPLGYVPTVK